MNAIGVTYGPGLVGALLVGVAEAKAAGEGGHLPSGGRLRALPRLSDGKAGGAVSLWGSSWGRQNPWR